LKEKVKLDTSLGEAAEKKEKVQVEMLRKLEETVRDTLTAGSVQNL